MEIIGLLTIALVAGTLARTLYADAMPTDVGPSLLVGGVAVATGYAISDLTGIGAMASAGDVASWLTALTCSCLIVAVGDALRSVAEPLRGYGRADQA